jgi:hypothetical protein
MTDEATSAGIPSEIIQEKRGGPKCRDKGFTSNFDGLSYDKFKARLKEPFSLSIFFCNWRMA